MPASLQIIVFQVVSWVLYYFNKNTILAPAPEHFLRARQLLKIETLARGHDLVAHRLKHKLEKSIFPRMKAMIIFVKKRENELAHVINSFNESFYALNLKPFPIYGFSATTGQAVNPADVLTDEALADFRFFTKNNYQKHRYELTSGGIGCFLSHLSLYKQLVMDEESDFYFILETDSRLDSFIWHQIGRLWNSLPDKWGIYLPGYAKIFQYERTNSTSLYKVYSFWGLHGYIVSKHGARSILKAYDKVDSQIDSWLSRLAIESKLSIYAQNMSLVSQIMTSHGSDVQAIVFNVNKTDSFMYRGLYLGGSPNLPIFAMRRDEDGHEKSAIESYFCRLYHYLGLGRLKKICLVFPGSCHFLDTIDSI